MNMNKCEIPANLGDKLCEIDTPALIVDLDSLESNIKIMAISLEGSRASLRPHSKSHKCPEIAKLQINAGAIGICCQKVSEAEAMVESGIEDVLISNQIVGQKKLDRLMPLCRRAKLSVCIDDTDNIQELNAAAVRHGTSISVLVEIDVGAHRCGVKPGEEALILAKQIDDASNLHFSGLQAYQGKAQHLRSYSDRKVAIENTIAPIQQTMEMMKACDLECSIVGGGGTGTYEFESTLGVYNEIQAGSYVFMDADYGLNLDAKGLPVSKFKNSLYVLTTVMSRAVTGQAVVDAGLKAYSVDSGLPTLPDLQYAEFAGASDEHGVIRLLPQNNGPKLGDKLRLIPGHCDPTVNLHSWIVGIRNNTVECLWPISARGVGI